MPQYFSVPGFFVLFRETIECGIIVAVCLQVLEKLQNKTHRKYVWYGTLAGGVLSLLLGAIFIGVFYAAREKIFTGAAEEIFEGAMMIFAVVIITLLGAGLTNILYKQQKWEQKIEAAQVVGSSGWGLFCLAFSSVVREGIESVVFIAGVGAAESDIEGIIIGAVCGLVVGVIVSVALYFGSLKVPLKWFLIASTIVLFFIAAGLTSRGFHEFQEADLFGPYQDKENRPWWNVAVYSWKECCNDKTNEFWALMRALFGYQDAPTFVEMFVWWFYWPFALLIILFRNRLLCFKGLKPLKSYVMKKSEVRMTELESSGSVATNGKDRNDKEEHQLPAFVEEPKQLSVFIRDDISV